jgi:hypothetical protein
MRASAPPHTVSRWVGYKVHLSQTGDDDSPHLITHVATTPGPTADGAVTPPIHRDLQTHGLLPSVPLVATGFLEAELMGTSKRDYAVELLGPTRRDRRWQARASASERRIGHGACPDRLGRPAGSLS